MHHQLTAFYYYVGGGLGASSEYLPDNSGTTAGPWNHFATNKPISVGSFAGPARFTTGGFGSHTLNYLHIPMIGGTNFGVYIKMNTGNTYGLGLSSSVGFLVWEPVEIMDYSGG